MRHSRVLFILAVLVVGALATGFYQGGQYPKLRGDRLTIDTGGDGTAVVLTQQAGPTLYVDSSAIIDGNGTIVGNMNSYAHTVDGQGLKAFLIRLQNPAPNNAKMIEFLNYVVLDTNYWLYMDANNQWDTEGELLTSSLGVNVLAPVSPFHLYEDTAATGATVGLTVEQDGAGDALLQILLTGGQRYVMGIDNDYGDLFKISPSADLSTGPFWGFATGGLTISHSVGDNLGKTNLISERDTDEDDLYEITILGKDDAADSVEYCEIKGYIVDNADGSEDGGISLSTAVDGGMVETLTVRRDNVGIGELTPADKLEIQGGGIIVDGSANVDWSFDGHNMFHTSDNTSASGWAGGNATNAGANIALFGGTHATLANICRWRAGGTEVMRLDANGDLSIGTAASGAYRLDAFVSAEDYIAKMFNDGGAVTNKGLLIQMGEDAQSAQNFPLDIADGDGGLEGGVESNNGTVAIYNVSDEKLKKDIEDTKIIATDILGALKVRDFKWKDSGKESTGFIAQEVAEAYPVMAGEVTYTRNLDTGTTKTIDGLDTWVFDRETTTLLTVTPARLLPVLVKGFQEQEAQIKSKADKDAAQNEAQQAQIESLEARLVAIESLLAEALKEIK